MEDIKEKTADEMFEELGYKKTISEILPKVITVRYDDYTGFKSIYFNLDKKFYSVSCINKDFEKVSVAINKKCKELRLVRR